MINQFLKDMPAKLDKSVEFFSTELSSIHTGRASVSMVDDIYVDAYGSKQQIKQIANITIPESRQILIQPWDKGVTSQIEAAIRDSGMGFNPVNAGDVVRINIPELTEERRKGFVKIAKEKAEEAKVGIRTARSEVWNAIKKAKTDGDISEDDMYFGEAEIQKIVDRYNKKVEELLITKEKELLEV
ncbi:MAG: ribosome recycling factor [bacterium]